MKFWATGILLAVLTIAGCTRQYPFYDGAGKKPVYISYDSLGHITNLPPLPVKNSGPIYLHDTLLFMVEQRQGIHVFSLADTVNPVQITFLQIPAINDFTISGNTLYADNGPNLITIDITNLYQISVLNTSNNVFYPTLFPQLYVGFFECVDEKQGVVIDWKDTVLTNAKCQTLQ